MISSLFLFNRVVQRLLEEESTNYSTAATALKDNIYVDDAFLGCETEDEAIKLQQDVIQLTRKGEFQLRKWLSNSPKLLEAILEKYLGTPLLFGSDEQSIYSILGLKLFPPADVFSYLVTASD